MSKSQGPLGVLNINKTPGWTSHDVVARVRRIAQTRRVGHAGTLDPMATGVLVVCLNQATRIVEYLTEGTKEYLAQIQFGTETDTWDADGQVIATQDVAHLCLAEIQAALPAFCGAIDQVPPMFSALKRDGQPLYKLARQGISVERASRQVQIHALEVLDWQPPTLSLRVRCSKGTYIRSLAHDLGAALGVGAHLTALQRTAVGPFALAQAVTLEQLAAAEDWTTYLTPLRQALSHLPQVMVSDEDALRISQGQTVALKVEPNAPLCVALNQQGLVMALLVPAQTDQDHPDSDVTGIWQPHKVLRPET